uniref:DNA-directed RNA polymerase n=1 Tax=Palpitomonas bilix TaxID=652834 RepID=A0A7S3DLZ2_9EUKA
MDEEDEVAVNDGEEDTFMAKEKERHQDQTSYEEADDEEKAADEDEGGETKSGAVEDNADEDDEDDEVVVAPAPKKAPAKKAKATKVTKTKLVDDELLDDIEWREEKNYSSLHVAVTVPMDICAKRLLMVGLAEDAAKSTVVRATEGIANCYLMEGDGGTGAPGSAFAVQTEGVNFSDLFDFADVVNLDYVMSNHIYLILHRYGVEAARSAITREIKNVFGAYGIGVDGRHLSLLADYMTFNGDYRACNRIGMDYCSSPFQKMSFETTLQFLKKSLIGGEGETLSSPSANLVLGQPFKLGTGMMDVYHRN